MELYFSCNYSLAIAANETCRLRSFLVSTKTFLVQILGNVLIKKAVPLNKVTEKFLKENKDKLIEA